MEQQNLHSRRCDIHPEHGLRLVCFNKNCKENRLICQNCAKIHSGHNQLKDDENLEKQVEQTLMEQSQLIKKCNQIYDDLTQMFQKLMKSIQKKYEISISKMQKMDNIQLNQFINELINFPNLENNLIPQLKEKCENFKVFLNQSIEDLGLQQLNYNQICKVDQQKVEEIFDTGYKYYKKDEYAKAIELFDQALQFDQEHINSLFYKGESLRLKNYFMESLEYFEKVLQIDSKHKQALRCKGRNLSNICFGVSLSFMQKRQEAMKYFDEALEIDKNFINALYNKGDNLRMMSQYQQALEQFDRVLQIDKNHDNSLGSKGACLIQLGRFEEAKQCLQQAIKLRPNYQWNQNQLQILQTKMKK